MALIPYDGMTLALPERDGDWIDVISKEAYAVLVDSAIMPATGRRQFLNPLWSPLFTKSSDWDYEYSGDGINFAIENIFGKGSFIGIGGRCLTTDGPPVLYGRYQGVYTGALKSQNEYGHNILSRTVAITSGSISPILCSTLQVKKDGEYFYLRLSNETPVAKLHRRWFYYDNGVPDATISYKVRASWKSLIDPNDAGGESTSGGGSGTHDDSTDRIDIPGLPDISAAQAGLITLFKPSLDNLKSLNSYLWTNWRDVAENIQKFFSNPIDYIIALNIVPVDPLVGTSRNIKLGLWESTVAMPPVLNQWYEFDCGSIYIPEYWGSALDYAPNTKISCMLPYIGSVNLNTDEIMGKSLSLKYHIDLLSGSCVAILSVNNSVYYQFTGECAVSIPLTGADWSRVYSAAVGAIGTAISGGLAAGAGGAIAQAGLQSSNMLAAKNGIQAADVFSNAMDNVKKYSKGAPAMRESLQKASNAARNIAMNAATNQNVGNAIKASHIVTSVNNSVGQVMSGKVSVQHSGSISGAAGMLGVRVPFVTIEFPNQSLAENYKHFVGYPSNIFAKLGDVSGYTECEQVIIENFPGTDNELAEVLESLKGGVYL